MLDSLPARDRKVLELRFGLKGERPRTLEEVGERFGVTRERIRQVEAKTLNRLKHYPRRPSSARYRGLERDFSRFSVLKP